MILAAALFAAGVAAPVRAGPTGSSAGAAAGPSVQGATARYARLEAEFVAQGRLREVGAPADAPWDAATLARDFGQIALFTEYATRGGGFTAARSRGVLRRWVEPVRIGVRFGPSVPAAQQRADADAVARYAGRLRAITGHPVAAVRRDANLLVLVVSDEERRGLGPYLAQVAPWMSRGVRRAILGMPAQTLCLVIARPHDDARAGYRDAVAVVRAEHPPRLRRSCLEEELAQAMGLPNDSAEARPSIFNDDEEFGVLTRHDEALLRMLYDPRLSPGMTAEQVAPLLPAVARDAAR